jgi:hypothetical protein
LEKAVHAKATSASTPHVANKLECQPRNVAIKKLHRQNIHTIKNTIALPDLDHKISRKNFQTLLATRI